MNTTEPKQVRKTDDPIFRAHLADLLRECGGDPDSFAGRMVSDLALNVFKLVTDGRDSGELKLLNASFKELRYAYNVFADHTDRQKISIFGSARTKPEHPDYIACVDFSRKMSERGWHCITGAGDGIM